MTINILKCPPTEIPNVVQKPIAKIGDFGLSAPSYCEYLRRSIEMNPRWAAPEVLAGRPYNTKSDIYAFGLLIWEMRNREVPFTSNEVLGSNNPFHENQLKDEIICGLRPKMSKIENELDQLMVRCWSSNPIDRPTVLKVFLQLKDIIHHELPSLSPSLPDLPKQSELSQTDVDCEWRMGAQHQINIANHKSRHKDKKILSATLAENYIWFGCNDGSIGVVDTNDLSSPPIWAFNQISESHEEHEISESYMSYSSLRRCVWYGTSGGLIQVRD
jgi:serine/threonine protein kinase